MALAFEGDGPPRSLTMCREIIGTTQAATDAIAGINGILTQVRCLFCQGNVWADHGALTCMMCARMMYISEISDDGRTLVIDRTYAKPALVSVGQRESRRQRRGDEGLTGLAARILAQLPARPGYATCTAIVVALNLRRPEVLDVLCQLETQGFVERYAYQRGYRTGWRRREER